MTKMEMENDFEENTDPSSVFTFCSDFFQMFLLISPCGLAFFVEIVSSF